MSDFGDMLISTQGNAQYDQCVKELLAFRIILANILVHVVPEFYGMEPEEVELLIEKDPQISTAGVAPGHSNHMKITGMNNENKVNNEGSIYYDIIFFIRMTHSLRKMIINLEVQKEIPSRYNMVKRSVFYASRELSAQYGREFVNSNYNEIKKVYSIWICMNVPKSYGDGIALISLTKEDIAGENNWIRDYDLLDVVMISMTSKIPEATSRFRLHRFLGILLSHELTAAEKKTILSSEYHIPVTGSLEKEVNTMCNLSEAVEAKGIEKGLEQGIKALIHTCKSFGVTKEMTIQKLSEEFHLSSEKASEVLDKYWE